jgi:DNA-directed RNA polymerase specialized sigma24 family protein
MSRIVHRYLPAVRRYLGAWFRNDALAEELTAEVAARLLGNLGKWPGTGGRFRDFVRRQMFDAVSAWRSSTRKELSLSDLDEGLARFVTTGAEAPENDGMWRHQVRQLILDGARKALNERSQTRPVQLLQSLWDRFEQGEDVEEATGNGSGEEGDNSTGTASDFKARNNDRKILERARRLCAGLLVDEVKHHLAFENPTPDRVREELRDLQLMGFVDRYLAAILPP